MVPMWALEDASSYLQLEESLYVQQQQLESWGLGRALLCTYNVVVHILQPRPRSELNNSVHGYTMRADKVMICVLATPIYCMGGTNSCFAESISAHCSKTVRMMHFGWSIAVKYYETQFGPVNMHPIIQSWSKRVNKNKVFWFAGFVHITAFCILGRNMYYVKRSSLWD